jgi:short-subunit dehydrogenase
MKNILITGGSSGIGLDISRLFAKEGFKLYWVSWSSEELSTAKNQLLKEFPACKIETFVQDLSRMDSAEAVLQWIESQDIQLDVLINNAGVGIHGLTKDNSIQKELGMIQLNVVTPYKLTRYFLNHFLAKNEGCIINISSNTSFQPVARMNTYASTKAFIKHFSMGLQEEMEILNSKVRIVTICPAAIKDTAFKVAANMEKAKTFSGIAVTTSKEVAKDVWFAYKSGKNYRVTGWKMRIMQVIRPIVPYGIQQAMVRKETKIS